MEETQNMIREEIRVILEDLINFDRESVLTDELIRHLARNTSASVSFDCEITIGGHYQNMDFELDNSDGIDIETEWPDSSAAEEWAKENRPLSGAVHPDAIDRLMAIVGGHRQRQEPVAPTIQAAREAWLAENPTENVLNWLYACWHDARDAGALTTVRVPTEGGEE